VLDYDVAASLADIGIAFDNRGDRLHAAIALLDVPRTSLCVVPWRRIAGLRIPAGQRRQPIVRELPRLRMTEVMTGRHAPAASLPPPGRLAPMNRAGFADPRGQPAEAGAR